MCFETLLMISDSLVFHFDTNLRFMMCFEKNQKDSGRKTMQSPLIISQWTFVQICCGDLIDDKSDVAYGPLPIEAKGLICIFSVCFHLFRKDSKLSGLGGGSSLWAPVAACGGKVVPL